MIKYSNIYLNNQYLLSTQNQILCPYCAFPCEAEMRETDRWTDKEIIYTCFVCCDFRIFFYPKNFIEIILEFNNYSLSYVYPINICNFSFTDTDKHTNLDWPLSIPNLLDLQAAINYIELIKFYS